MTAMGYNSGSVPESAFWPGQSKMTVVDSVYARLPSKAVTVEGLRIVAEPKTIGSADRGRRILGGKLPFGSEEYSIPAGGIWETDGKNHQLLSWIHGFTWLDDLAALRDGAAISFSKESVLEWIRRYHAGRGPGWTADIAARRLIRWVGHSWFLMSGWTEKEREIFAGAIFNNVRFVERRWKSLPRGVRRFEALAGMIYANSMFPNREPALRIASESIAQEANRMIGLQGEIPSRNPEELLQVTTLLSWTETMMIEAEIAPSADLVSAIKRAALVLRAVRHATGSLARFHGGGSGPTGYLDRVLAESGERYVPLDQLSMGYSRLSARGASVVADAAAPNSGEGSESSHASTLAFELHANGCPIIVNRGGVRDPAFEAERELRETRSSSTIEVDGNSSSQFAQSGAVSGARDSTLSMVPRNVRIEQLPGADGQTLIASHDGYRPRLGLTHMRRIDLAEDGGRLWGEDTIWARSKEDRDSCSNALKERKNRKIAFAAHFHIHPETKIARSGNTVTLKTQNGDHWNFRFEGGAELKIAPSEYMDEVSGKSRSCVQIKLESAISAQSGQLRWKFERLGSPQSALLTVGSADEKSAGRRGPNEKRPADRTE